MNWVFLKFCIVRFLWHRSDMAKASSKAESLKIPALDGCNAVDSSKDSDNQTQTLQVSVSTAREVHQLLQCRVISTRFSENISISSASNA